MVFLILTFALFGISLTNTPFIFDDYFHVFDNKWILSRSLDGFIHFFTNSLTPIPFVIWKLISLVNLGDHPEVYRSINYLIHAFNAHLVYVLAQMIFEKVEQKEVKILSWVAALFYLIHPTQVESVAWISSLRGLTATMFALLFLLSALKKKNVAIAYLILGLLCKPTMISIFLYFIFLLLFIFKEKLSPVLKGICLAGFLMSPIVLFIHKSNILTTYFSDLSFWLRVKVIIASSSAYLLNVFLPFSLTFDYQINPFVISYLEETQNSGALMLLGPLYILIMSALIIKERTKILGLLGLSPFLLLTPHMGFILHDFANISVVSDRYLNLALLGFSLFASLSLYKLFLFSREKFKIIPPYFHYFFLMTILSWLTLYQVSKWAQPTKLLKSSQVFMELREPVLIALANQKINQGDFQNARVYLKQALAQNSDSAGIIERLMEINELSPSKKEDQFIMDYVENPHFEVSPRLYIHLAEVYLRYLKIDKANDLVNMAISQRQDLKKAHLLQEKVARYGQKLLEDSFRNLEIYYQTNRDYKRAIEYLDRLIKMFPLEKGLKMRREDYLEKLKDN